MNKTTDQSTQEFERARILSPRRHSTQADSIEGLAQEQLKHYGIDEHTAYGQALLKAAQNLYHAQSNISDLWKVTEETLSSLPQSDRTSYFNAKKFLSFQLAKILDTLQNPFRKTSQSLQKTKTSMHAKGHYALFDNITAIFSATPVIVRTATYVYACTEWVDDAFQGREPTHQIYSRLLNPTSISLANAIVDLEAGPYATDYLAWNFNSGMAAIDGLLSNVLNRDDILIVSRNVYGGVHQLLEDYFAKSNRMNIKLQWFDGTQASDVEDAYKIVTSTCAERIKDGSQIHVYLESPCNPHGYMLDVPEICKFAHSKGSLVMLDSTLATPMLSRPLQRKDKNERPDYVVHSYTKDLSGHGSTTAGGVIAENWRMFMGKGDSVNGLSWDRTMFWDVYYIKGAFLDADKAFEVITGMKTLESRMLEKCINTSVLAQFLASHPLINVNSHAAPGNENAPMREKLLNLALPVPLFTIDLEPAQLNREVFVRFFDGLEPAFNHMVSIGQCNTMALCPALTSHSELDDAALKSANICLTTIRISVGNESVRELIAHFITACQKFIDPVHTGFSSHFMDADKVDQLVSDVTLDTHRKKLSLAPGLNELLK
ncbi:MAG: trans-sulfuration enzyme family protein [bacterium]